MSCLRCIPHNQHRDSTSTLPPHLQECEAILYVMRLDVGSLTERLETSQARGPGLVPGQQKQTQFDPEVILRVLSHR